MIEEVGQPIRLLAGLGALQIVGYGLLTLICPASGGLSCLERQAYGFGLGVVGVTLWMLILSILELSFSVPLILGPWLALAAIGLFWKKNQRVKESPTPPVLETTENRKRKTENRFQGWDWFFFGLLAVLFLFATLRAVLYPMWAWDALATWGFKAKVFYLNRAINLQGFEAHNYYPNLVPLFLTYLYLMLMQVNDHLAKLIFPLFGAALLSLLYSLFLRMGLTRRQSLGLTTFFALNGVTFIVHLYIAYADLALTYFILGAAGLTYLWLNDRAPRGCLPLIAAFCAGITWCKFEGAPLAAAIILAAALTLAWLRPPLVGRRLLGLTWPIAGVLLGYLPWRLFLALNHIEIGSDHVLGFYPEQLAEAIPALLAALINPKFFGILWPVALIAIIVGKKRFFISPRLFLVLFIGGNLVAILLGYAVAPTSAAEFPLYVRATLDRLLLHLSPAAALVVGEGLRDLGGGTEI